MKTSIANLDGKVTLLTKENEEIKKDNLKLKETVKELEKENLKWNEAVKELQIKFMGEQLTNENFRNKINQILKEKNLLEKNIDDKTNSICELNDRLDQQIKENVKVKLQIKELGAEIMEKILKIIE